MMKLERTVKFHVDLYDPRQGTVWTQEFIKPLVNYVSNVWKDHEGNPLVLKSFEEDGYFDTYGDTDLTNVDVYDLFDDEVEQTLNTYGEEQGWGYDMTVYDVRAGRLNVCIGVSPARDYHNDGYEDGYFDFYEDRCNGTEVWKEVLDSLTERMVKIRKEDFEDFTSEDLKEVA